MAGRGGCEYASSAVAATAASKLFCSPHGFTSMASKWFSSKTSFIEQHNSVPVMSAQLFSEL